MKILHVHAGNLYGGVETVLVTLARHSSLCPGLEQRFALCFEGRLSAELSALDAQDARARSVTMLQPVRASRPWTVWRARARLARLLREGCDVMICHSAWSHALFAPVGRRAGVALVFWLHGVVGRRGWPERLSCLSPPDLALCNSRFTAASLPRLFPDVRSEVFYTPVTPPSASSASSASTRATLSARLDQVVILQVGRMEPIKGHLILIEALARLAGDPRWVCWIAGGAQRESERGYAADLADRAAQLGIAERVRFLAERSDVAALFAAADVVCQPNTGPEGFGLVFVEALLAGRPVVTSDLGAAGEVVGDSCGVLVPRGDPALLADALGTLIGDPAMRAALGAAGPARARALCAPETQMPKLEQLLRAAGRSGGQAVGRSSAK